MDQNGGTARSRAIDTLITIARGDASSEDHLQAARLLLGLDASPDAKPEYREIAFGALSAILAEDRAPGQQLAAAELILAYSNPRGPWK